MKRKNMEFSIMKKRKSLDRRSEEGLLSRYKLKRLHAVRKTLFQPIYYETLKLEGW
jgi:hypothetical protein